MEHNDRVTSTKLTKSSDARSGLFLFCLSFIAAVFAFQVLDPGAPRPRALFITPPALQHFAFGAKEQIADTLWIRSLQDFDYCEHEVAKQVCVSNGWLYRVLDLVTDLSPKFRIAYATGGLALTILVNDIPGASKMFDKGLKEFSHDLPLLERAAYHALYEEKDEQKAAQLLERAAKVGAPPWYYMLATRLYSHQGKAELAETLLRNLESEPHPDPVLLETLRKRVSQIRSDRN